MCSVCCSLFYATQISSFFSCITELSVYWENRQSSKKKSSPSEGIKYVTKIVYLF